MKKAILSVGLALMLGGTVAPGVRNTASDLTFPFDTPYPRVIAYNCFYV